jgi:hypothetical protein
MAYIDYIHCAICDAKCIYDGDTNYGDGNVGDAIVLCKKCVKDFEIIVIDKYNELEIENLKFRLKEWIQ